MLNSNFFYLITIKKLSTYEISHCYRDIDLYGV